MVQSTGVDLLCTISWLLLQNIISLNVKYRVIVLVQKKASSWEEGELNVVQVRFGIYNRIDFNLRTARVRWSIDSREKMIE